MTADATPAEAPRLPALPLAVTSPRAWLRLASRTDVPEILAFYARGLVTASGNAGSRAHFARWDPPRPKEFEEVSFWLERVERFAREARMGESLRMFMVDAAHAGAPLGRVAGPVLGFVSFTRFERLASGVVQAQVGYGLDATREGKGLMSEAIVACLGPLARAGVGRLVATYDVDNARSARLLARLGFLVEARLPEHLASDGALRDHVLVGRVLPT